MALDAYEHYWQSAMGLGAEQARQRQRRIRENSAISGTWGGQSDPLGTQTPAAQNKMLEHLSSMAAGRIDDWESLIDPTVSYGANKATLIDNGAQKPKTDRQREMRTRLADADERAQKHARDKIRAHFDEIEAGNADSLIDDIASEFSDEWVASVLEAERVQRSVPTDEITAPEPNEPEPTPAPTPKPNEPESTPEPEPVETTDRRRSVDKSVNTGQESTATPDYSGVFGFIRLLIHWLLAEHKTGQQRATEPTRKQQTLEAYQ